MDDGEKVSISVGAASGPILKRAQIVLYSYKYIDYRDAHKYYSQTLHCDAMCCYYYCNKI